MKGKCSSGTARLNSVFSTPTYLLPVNLLLEEAGRDRGVSTPPESAAGRFVLRVLSRVVMEAQSYCSRDGDQTEFSRAASNRQPRIRNSKSLVDSRGGRPSTNARGFWASDVGAREE